MTKIDKITPSTTGPLVVAPVYDGMALFEFAIVAEVFALARPEMGPGWYRFASVPIDPGPLRAQGGLTVTSAGDPGLLEQADLIVMAGWKGADVSVPDALARRLRQAWQRGARLASICSGAFVLAATGLLDGRRAATHWRYADRLRERHPAIEVDAGVLYVEADRVFTSAGSAAGIDLMLHLVRQDFGVEAANSVARRLVMPPHRGGGQAQFIERPVPRDRTNRLAGLMEQVRARAHRRGAGHAVQRPRRGDRSAAGRLADRRARGRGAAAAGGEQPAHRARRGRGRLWQRAGAAASLPGPAGAGAAGLSGEFRPGATVISAQRRR